MKIVFFGPPGAGKGTQADIVSEKLNIPTISTGAILREAIKNGTECGNHAKDFIENGELVPDEIIIEILNERLSSDDCLNGYILDGFPRTIRQADALTAMNINIDVVILIEVEDQTIIDRMSGRRLCNSCGLTYHVRFNPSPCGNNCGKCDSELITRKDDDPAVVLSRLITYHNETEPLVEYYSNKGVLKRVIGQEELSETTKLVLSALNIS